MNEDKWVAKVDIHKLSNISNEDEELLRNGIQDANLDLQFWGQVPRGGGPGPPDIISIYLFLTFIKEVVHVGEDGIILVGLVKITDFLKNTVFPLCRKRTTETVKMTAEITVIFGEGTYGIGQLSDHDITDACQAPNLMDTLSKLSVSCAA